MKIRKDMIFAVLTTFCMSALMFAVIPIRSGLPYDPWADYNDDNKIDMKDIGNAAIRFGALNTDNLTRNVNVTNWPEQPKQKLVWIGDWQLKWNSTSGGPIPITPIHTDYVGNYSQMTVVLKFSSANSNYGYVYLTPRAQWLYGIGDNPAFLEELSSTLYQIRPGGGLNCISVDTYPIKAPYVSIDFHIAFPSSTSVVIDGDAEFQVYLCLSNGATTAPLHKTMQWSEIIYAANDWENYGNYYLTGFREFTVRLYSNVTWTVYVQMHFGNGPSINVDNFSLSHTANRTYTIRGDGVFIQLYPPSTKPYYVIASFEATT